MGNCESAEEGVGYCNYGPISFWRYLFVLGNRTDIIIIPNSPIIIIIEFEVRVSFWRFLQLLNPSETL